MKTEITHFVTDNESPLGPIADISHRAPRKSAMTQ